jgi:hypothetical protein
MGYVVSLLRRGLEVAHYRLGSLYRIHISPTEPVWLIVNSLVFAASSSAASAFIKYIKFILEGFIKIAESRSSRKILSIHECKAKFEWELI